MRVVSGEILKIAGIVARAGDDKFGFPDFAPELVRLRSIDVFGMRGETEGQTGKLGSEEGHGSGSVAKMSVDVAYR